MKGYIRFFLRFASLALLVSVYSCNGCENKTPNDKKIFDEDALFNDQLVDDFNKSKLIFYSLPSPLETATLIKKAGASYDADLLNSVDNLQRYNTNLKMALNLGIYSTNMSFTSLFDQMQTTITYINASRKLAEQLGVHEAIDENTIRRLEQNINDRDVVLEIVAETFMNSNAYLSENNRPAIVAMILVGGWIEGLYIATQLTGGSLKSNPALIDRIVYQKLSLQTVINLLQSHSGNSDIEYLKERMYELKEIFDEVKIINKSRVEAETIPSQQMTIIHSESETEITPEVFLELVEKIKEIRTEFIS